METSNKSNAEPRQEGDNTQTVNNERSSDRSSYVAAVDEQIEPFAENDPFRASRITETVREAGELLAKIQVKATGFENLNEREFRIISKDASERATWSKARSDGFTGLLRLGRGTPSRYNRIL